MPIPESAPLRFTPRGVADAYDSSDTFPGACRKLQNLVFDPSNPELVVARPGVDGSLTAFAGFTTPGFISLQVTIGTRVYGMVATGLTAGKDQPFCYDLPTSSFVTVNGVTAGNSEGRPTSPSTTGAWTPPTAAMIGTFLIITHPGYTGAGSNFFGVINISTMTYTTANLATHGLPSVPVAVANLGNRAYFACANTVNYSDVLAPTTATNAGQSLTLGDNSPVITLSGLPVQTTTAGIVSALLCFKSTQIWQITGDAAITGSLALNYLSLNIGSACPRSVAPSPLGTFFAGPDSAYVVTPMGAVMPVTGDMSGVGSQPHLRQPFGYVTVPSRVAGAFAGNIYRLCMPTIIDGTTGIYDFWFDTRRLRWNGPHTFNYDCASSAGNYFIVSGQAAGAKLFQSNPFPATNTLYTDNGAAYICDMVTADLPKHDEMAMKQVVESTVELSSAGSANVYGITAFDDKANFLASTSVTTAQSGGVWGSNHWGDGTKWTGRNNQPFTYKIWWQIPLVFNKLAIEITCPAAAGVSIGTFFARAQTTGYTLQDTP